MSWYNETVFYHIYPLGMTNAPKENDYSSLSHRLNTLVPWLNHIQEIGCNGLYIGPLFESGSHGYDTVDYKKVDTRLGNNEDLSNFIKKAHELNIKVILDGVFNHVGRDFFAFKDVLNNRENSIYKDWFCNVNFYNNNSYNDGLSYDNWGGYDLLVKLNQRNPEVVNYLMDVVRYWINEFDIDGLRLDAADVLDFDFMKTLRYTTDQSKSDFWLMGEVIHGDYSRWVNDSTLHSVTNYQLHKGLYSGMNDHNFFEIAHTVNRLLNIGNLDLYNFVDNHDTERIITKLNNKAHYLPVHTLLYTLPGIPSVYYGSELGLEGHKYRGGSDDEIRPYINQEDYKDCLVNNPYTQIISILGNLRKNNPILSYGTYNQIELQTEYYSFVRELENHRIYVFVSNCDNPHTFYINDNQSYKGILTNKEYIPNNDTIEIQLEGNGAEILVESGCDMKNIHYEPIDIPKVEKKESKEFKPFHNENISNKPYEEMSIEELQDAILNKMANNGPINDQMLKSVRENVYPDSLLNWVKSFH